MLSAGKLALTAKCNSTTDSTYFVHDAFTEMIVLFLSSIFELTYYFNPNYQLLHCKRATERDVPLNSQIERTIAQESDHKNELTLIVPLGNLYGT